MVEGEAEVHDRADGDGVVDHDGSLDDGLGRYDGGLRVADQRPRDNGAQQARVVDRERPALDVSEDQLACMAGLSLDLYF